MINDPIELVGEVEAFRQTVLTQIRLDNAGEQELYQTLRNTNIAEDIFLCAHRLYEKRINEINDIQVKGQE